MDHKHTEFGFSTDAENGAALDGIIANMKQAQMNQNEFMKAYMDSVAFGQGATKVWFEETRKLTRRERFMRSVREVQWRIEVAFDVLRKGDASSHLGDY